MLVQFRRDLSIWHTYGHITFQYGYGKYRGVICNVQPYYCKYHRVTLFRITNKNGEILYNRRGIPYRVSKEMFNMLKNDYIKLEEVT